MAKAPLQQRLPSQESLLLDYVQRLEKHNKGRRAVHIHLSDLLAQNRREHHVRIAANSFEGLVRMLQGQLFILTNTDLMFVFKEASLDEVESAIVKLRFLFSDDPLLAEEGEARSAFASWYVLDHDYDKLLRLARRLAGEEQERRAIALAKATAAAPPAAARGKEGEPLSPLMLAQVEAALARADLSNLMRRQAVCVMVGRSAPQPVFNELFVSIADLRQTLLPRANLAASRWLFQQLTETLDRRVLAMLNKHDDRTLTGDISINLNLQTLLSPEFLVFDDNVRAGKRGTIVLELQQIDILADLGGYLFARDFAHERGYRICIDGLSHDALPFVERERLGADLVKLVWTPDITDLALAQAHRLADAVTRAGPSRVILCRVDSPQAVDWGHRVDLTLFQGRYVEGLLAAESGRGFIGPARRKR